MPRTGRRYSSGRIAGRSGILPDAGRSLHLANDFTHNVINDIWKRALVLAPHTDDGELGCGGTLALLANSGCHVRYIAFSVANRSLPAGFPLDTLAHEARDATSVLGISDIVLHDFDVRTFPEHRQEILELLVEETKDYRPDVVFQPSPSDMHQDHQTVAKEGLRAFKRTTVLGYLLPWNTSGFSDDCYIAFGEQELEQKVEAVGKYASQRHRSYTDPDYIRSLARVHGVTIGRPYAEVFKVSRLVIDSSER
jgi:LmbE family N-acetylglucosaminyl deacetylase